MTPEQQEFYEKLGDALRGANVNTIKDAGYDVLVIENNNDDLQPIISAAQKLHNLWPTLCDLDEVETN